ncbi:DUF4835 family protein [Aurantibacter sp.]|uniref:type IX secretion system protein PorD n=1 Tax=Aurantibacter sp. TaxID=2807103 RepID=UPI0035C828C3
MRNYFILLFLLFVTLTGFSQDLNAKVIVNAQLTGDENIQVFKTLEKQLNEFVNNSNWSKKEVKSQERVNCNFVINITEYSGTFFSGNLQVQSSRPVFGSSYASSLYNVNDKDFTFEYTEFQIMQFTPNQYQNNLVSVMAFHIYMILGLDADSFSPNGGTPHFKQAQQIVNYSQQENYAGWKLSDGLQSRFKLIDDLLSPAFSDYRTIVYNYHRLGLDLMNENVKEGKTQIVNALSLFNSIASKRPNAYVTRVFFDTKADEIEKLFTDGPSVNVDRLLTVLNRIAPMYSAKWRNLKF